MSGVLFLLNENAVLGQSYLTTMRLNRTDCMILFSSHNYQTLKLKLALLAQCSVTKHKEHWNKWTVDQCWWIDVIKERYGLNESMHFAAKELNGATARNAGYRSAGIDKVTSANSFGICKSSCRPSKVQSKARIRVTACTALQLLV
jgi:hypothetical protein